MINRWTHDPKDNKRKRIDHRKTALAKEKLIAEGKKPYNKEEAEIYKLRGLKYDGVPYVVYQEDTSFYNIDIVNNQYVAHQNLDFEHTEYYSRELRGKSHEQNAAEIKDKINHTDNYNEIVELLNRVKDNLLSEPEIVSM